MLSDPVEIPCFLDWYFLHAHRQYFFRDHSQQTFVLVKTSWRRLDQDQHIPLDHKSSEDVFKTSWRHPEQDQYIRHSGTSSRRLQDAFKSSSKTSWRRLEDALERCLEELLKKVFKAPWIDTFKTSSRCFQDIFKTSSRRLEDLSSS